MVETIYRSAQGDSPTLIRIAGRIRQSSALEVPRIDRGGTFAFARKTAGESWRSCLSSGAVVQKIIPNLRIRDGVAVADQMGSSARQGVRAGCREIDVCLASGRASPRLLIAARYTL